MFLLADALEHLRTIRPKCIPRLQVIPFQHIYRILSEGDLDAVVGFGKSPLPLKSLLFIKKL